MSAPDTLVRTVSERGGIAVRSVVGTSLVRAAASRHKTSATAGIALGRALLGAVLLAASGKQGETVQLQFRGDGPLGTLMAVADADGHVRGYATHPSAQPPPVRGDFDVAGAVGRGVLAVVRQRADGGAPYSGIVPLATGTVAQDLAHYLTDSEQNHNAVGLGVVLDRDGDVEAAGGFTVYVLPDADEEEVSQAEENVRGFPGPGEMVREGLDADAIVDRLLVGLGSRARHRSRPEFRCDCDRGRVLRAVSLLGREDLEASAQRGETIEILCRFCAERYLVSPDEIGDLLSEH